MTLPVLITAIKDVRPHGDNLSIITVDGHEVVANRREDGNFRWVPDEVAIYVPEGVVIPDDVLRERGYFDEERGKGLLEGKKGNRVKMRRFAGHESRGLLFKVVSGEPGTSAGDWLVERGKGQIAVALGDDVAEFLGIVDHVAG
jgi:hypothetical protein